MVPMAFKKLSPEEAEMFTGWAQVNYQPFDDIKGIWHPVIQQACVDINKEKAKYED